MEIELPAELDSRLSRLAEEQGRDRSALVVEAVERMVEHEDWFVAEVEKGLKELEQARVLGHEEVGERLAARLAQRRTA